MKTVRPPVMSMHVQLPIYLINLMDTFTVLAEDGLHLESRLRWNDEKLMVEWAEVQQGMSPLVRNHTEPLKVVQKLSSAPLAVEQFDVEAQRVS